MDLIKELGKQFEHNGVQRSEGSRYGLYACPECGAQSAIRMKTIKLRKFSVCNLCRNAKTRLPPEHIKIRRVLDGMRKRCRDETRPDWVHYHDISVCDEWLNDYGAFTLWALDNGYSPGKQIDRIDPDKDYTPDNCRWVDKYIQGQNKRLINASNTIGYRGVVAKENGRFSAHITVYKNALNLGTFSTALEAALAYDNFILLHPEANHPTNFDYKPGEDYSPKLKKGNKINE